MKKTVLITGASGAIGSACAEEAALAGYNVVLGCNTSPDTANKLKEKLNTLGCSALVNCADVLHEHEVDCLFSAAEREFGGVDLLICNAGVSLERQLQDCTSDDYERVFGVNMRGVFLCCKRALPYMLSKKAGSIVNISSMWGISGASCETLYSASKAAVIGFTKATAKELAPSGIRVNCVAPGVINSKMNAHLSPQELAELANETPLGRLGEPADVAKTVMFLLSEATGFITGQTISVDGGFIL